METYIGYIISGVFAVIVAIVEVRGQRDRKRSEARGRSLWM